MNNHRTILTSILTCVLLIFTTQSCGVKYSLSGGSIPENMNTYTVDFFENIAAMVIPSLSQDFTEGLKERIRTQSRLNQVDQNGDAIFEGVITNYAISSSGVEANTNLAALNRLSITVKVKYTNRKDESGESDYEDSFTQFREFRGMVNSATELQLTREIILMLTEDIYNRTFNNW
ncbi:LPS assembly lipoprotein LptE [Sphingobacterium sp. lm-10]|uniref:LptE family protein n=1 Tax=Sphingobacterium sp. lm-10 TaxID=2944904 RepID=UPI0020201269|nr:LptE family protein [Sphingobacterium sp. lm-10]MCL7989457.1 LPS assembly lipoprotein LptE [Sphingobacterium sp. lm-10]